MNASCISSTTTTGLNKAMRCCRFRKIGAEFIHLLFSYCRVKQQGNKEGEDHPRMVRFVPHSHNQTITVGFGISPNYVLMLDSPNLA